MSLFEKLRKVEALLQGTSSEGERQAAERALQRLLERAAQESIEYTVKLDGHWKKALFIALCRKHQLKPYRYARQRHTTTMVRTSKAYMDEVLWPEFKKYAGILEGLVKEIMDDLIHKIHNDTDEETVIAGELGMESEVAIR